MLPWTFWFTQHQWQRGQNKYSGESKQGLRVVILFTSAFWFQQWAKQETSPGWPVAAQSKQSKHSRGRETKDTKKEKIREGVYCTSYSDVLGSGVMTGVQEAETACLRSWGQSKVFLFFFWKNQVRVTSLMASVPHVPSTPQWTLCSSTWS